MVRHESVNSVSKEPIPECRHSTVDKCHYTYVTYFRSAQQETCEENFEKKCQITFKQAVVQERERKCHRPQRRVCNGQGPELCTTRSRDQGDGKFLGDTMCEKLPVAICGSGCVSEEGPEEWGDQRVDPWWTCPRSPAA